MVNEEVHSLISDCATRHSAQVIDISIRGSEQKPSVEIFVDWENGITSDICSAISREAAAILDGKIQFKNPYQLVVSSPGIERPLKFPWQFRKHIGRKLSLKLVSGNVEEKQALKLLSVTDDRVMLETGKGDEPKAVRFDDILEAVVRAPW